MPVSQATQDRSDETRTLKMQFDLVRRELNILESMTSHITSKYGYGKLDVERYGTPIQCRSKRRIP